MTFDPTETSTEAFLSAHGALIDWGAELLSCKCGFGAPDELVDQAQLTAHLFEASRSIMYRESAAILQDAAASADEERAPGLHRGFRIMMERADIEEVFAGAYVDGQYPEGLGYDNDTTAST